MMRSPKFRSGLLVNPTAAKLRDTRLPAPRPAMNRSTTNVLRSFVSVHNAFAACGAEGRVELCSSIENGAVVFRCIDDGSGIAGDARPRLFEPYFTTKSSGTGLGLAICRRLLQAHGGGIELESSEPGRTVFRVTVPVA